MHCLQARFQVIVHALQAYTFIIINIIITVFVYMCKSGFHFAVASYLVSVPALCRSQRRRAGMNWESYGILGHGVYFICWSVFLDVSSRL